MSLGTDAEGRHATIFATEWRSFMSYKAITYEIKNEIAIVTMNRPEARNALDVTMREEIADVTLKIRDDESLKAMILTGAGGAFCGGGDLKALTEKRQTAVSGRNEFKIYTSGYQCWSTWRYQLLPLWTVLLMEGGSIWYLLLILFWLRGELDFVRSLVG